MDIRRVLVVLGTDAAWSRGVLRGFMEVARESDFRVLHYYPGADLDWLAEQWTPDAVVFGYQIDRELVQRLSKAVLVSVTVDRSAEGIASVCPDEDGIAAMAFEHLRTLRLRHVTTFRFDDSAFAASRERAFIARARDAGIRVLPGWGDESFLREQRQEDPAAIVAWLRSLPRPCGVFSCTDGWGGTVLRYAGEAGLRVPEDLAVVGADNDVLQCELMSPPLSSVVVPWQEVGRSVAELVKLGLANQSVRGKRVVIAPTDIVSRRSSDMLSVDDALVATALGWIAEHATRRLTVNAVARAVGSGRQRLERRFRRVLDRSIQDEIRRAHVEVAKRCLETTDLDLAEVAKRSGFSSASLLNLAFRRELGVPPGSYRRLARQQPQSADDA